MSAVAKASEAKREVLVGQRWRRSDPSGGWKYFTIVRMQRNPFGQLSARGRTPSGKPIVCDLGAMQGGDPRYELVEDAGPRKVAVEEVIS